MRKLIADIVAVVTGALVVLLAVLFASCRTERWGSTAGSEVLY